ncbi:hypothetical protein IKA92_03500 [bacterium]|nr:hypothetical protein [bacterium]
MTIIRPVTAQDIRLKEKIAQAAKDADLNLSEILALNNKFGTTLEYTPTKDVVELTCYVNKNTKGGTDNFAKECSEYAFELMEKFGKAIKEEIIITSKSSLAENLDSALKKLKSVL